MEIERDHIVLEAPRIFGRSVKKTKRKPGADKAFTVVLEEHPLYGSVRIRKFKAMRHHLPVMD